MHVISGNCPFVLDVYFRSLGDEHYLVLPVAEYPISFIEYYSLPVLIHKQGILQIFVAIWTDVTITLLAIL